MHCTLQLVKYSLPESSIGEYKNYNWVFLVHLLHIPHTYIGLNVTIRIFRFQLLPFGFSFRILVSVIAFDCAGRPFAWVHF